jgi:DNA-binding protein H-NS
MDPLTLFALANGAVKLVKEGCKLYKDIKGAAGDIKDVLSDLDDQFAKKHKNSPPSIAEKNQLIAEKNRIIELNKKDGDSSNIYREIGEQLGAYFDNFHRCMAIFEEEERRSKTEAYHGEDSLGKRALNRVLMKKQLEQMSKELREIMVYQSPPELGALWTEVEAMMKEMGKQQSILIAEEMRREELALKTARETKRRRIQKIKCNIWKYSVTIIMTAYVTWLIWAIVQIRIETHPELGRCLLPKGQWPYQHYQNLKWVDCEINSNN